MVPGIGGKPVGETRVLLLRHAETADPGRFHGAESDVGLGARGGRQAAAVARALAAMRPDGLVCSAMRRARETADLVAEACGLVARLEPELHERKMGPLSGVPRDEGLAAYVEARSRWIAGQLEYTHEGGESYAEIRARVGPVFERLAREWRGRTVVIVAHGVVIRVLLTSLLQGYSPRDFDRIAIDNAALNDLRWDGTRWTAVALNWKVVDDEDLDGFAW
jgi:broad specificity phosphatase PhoE